MADLQHRCAAQNLTIAINVRIGFRKVNYIAAQNRDFSAKMPYDPTI